MEQLGCGEENRELGNGLQSAVPWFSHLQNGTVRLDSERQGSGGPGLSQSEFGADSASCKLCLSGKITSLV